MKGENLSALVRYVVATLVLPVRGLRLQVHQSWAKAVESRALDLAGDVSARVVQPLRHDVDVDALVQCQRRPRVA